MPVDFYQLDGSPPCRAVEMLAKELNIPLNKVVVNLHEGSHMKPDFLKLNPGHKVPVINDNGYVLSESRAIMRYLVDTYCPDSPLYPKDPKKRGEIDRILDFDCSNLAKCQFEGVYYPAFRNMNVTEDHRNFMKDALKVFDEYLTRTSYAASDRLTLADLSIFAHLTLSEKLNLDLSPYPKIVAWMNKLKKELPYHQEINEAQLSTLQEYLKKLQNK